MSDIKLTNNEVKALTVCLNSDNREAQLDDNFSNGGTIEFMEVCEFTSKKQVSGLISSLVQKGLGEMEDDEEYDIFWLSENGINTIFDFIENNKG